MPAPSYLQQRQHERRWRVVTALVAAGALATAAVWTLARYDAPHDDRVPAAHPQATHTAATTTAPSR